MIGHCLDLEAVGEAVGSQGFVSCWCHVDRFGFGHWRFAGCMYLRSFATTVILR